VGKIEGWDEIEKQDVVRCEDVGGAQVRRQGEGLYDRKVRFRCCSSSDVEANAPWWVERAVSTKVG
jgi:hypothetical protein